MRGIDDADHRGGNLAELGRQRGERIEGFLGARPDDVVLAQRRDP